MRKLFVSYARENKPDVDQLVEHLRTMGYDTWVDAALRGGQDWWDEILDRIADTDVVIAIYSSAALNSTACAREFEWATTLGKPVIPVAVEPPPAALPRRFARRQIIDYSQPPERPLAALQLQGALATLPPAPPLPDPLPDPPAAPLSYLTNLIDLITQATGLDHDQQHQILRQLEPALTAFDPLERQGGRDILERFSRRPDLYADVDRAITRLRQLSDQPVPVGNESSARNTPSTAEQSEVQVDTAPAELADQSPDTRTTDARHAIAATAATPLSSPASTPEPELTHQDEPALESDVAGDLAGTSVHAADADTCESTKQTSIAGSHTEAEVGVADEPAPDLKPSAQPDEHPNEVEADERLLQRLSRRTKIAILAGAGALAVVIAAAVGVLAVVGHRPSPSPAAPATSGRDATSTPFTSTPQINLVPVADWLGRWRGPATGDSSSYDVQIELFAQGENLRASVSYPQLDCSGTWTETTRNGNVRGFSEVIDHQGPEHKCIDDSSLSLTYNGATLAVHYALAPSDTRDINAVLTRID